MRLSKFFYNGLALALLMVYGNALAQTPGSLPEFLSGEERQQIEKENKEKDRTEALIKMSSIRLELAKNSFRSENFDLSRDELKNYGNLIDYTVNFINTSVKKRWRQEKVI